MTTTHRFFILVCAALVGMVLAGGCTKKPTRREVLEKHRAAFEQLRTELDSYSALLMAEPVKPVEPLDPKPVFNFGNSTWASKEKGPVRSNLCILPAAALGDLKRIWMHSFSNEIRLDNDLGAAFGWFDKSASDEQYLDEAVELDTHLQGLLNTRYIGLFKDTNYSPAKMEEGKTFVPGAMIGDLWLVDRPSRKVVFHGQVFAANGERVSVLHDRMRSLSKGDWERELFVDVKKRFLEQVMAVLTKEAGAEFPGWTPPAPPEGDPKPGNTRSGESEVLAK